MAIVFSVIEETPKSHVVWACECVYPDLITFHVTSLLHFFPTSVLFSSKPG